MPGHESRPPTLNVVEVGGLNSTNMHRLTHYILRPASYVLSFLLSAPIVYAANHDFGLKETAEAGGLKPIGREPAVGGVASLAGTLVGYLLAFVGVIFFALTIYGGILWMTARGNEEQVKKAQELIKSAVIGLVVVFLSYAVTNLVITNLVRTTQ